MEKIIFDKKYIQFDERKINVPFTKKDLDTVLGEPVVKVSEYTFEDGRTSKTTWCRWIGTGISAIPNSKMTYYKTLHITFADDNAGENGVYSGKVFIGKDELENSGFKLDYIEHNLKLGPFKMNTFLMRDIDQVPDDVKDLAIMNSDGLEIDYIPPRPKDSKYILSKLTEPVLHFDTLNFKLLVMDELMYRKGVLNPKFDIYDFAEENPKKAFDVDEEGYTPISLAKKWFQEYEVPAKYADEITELVWDGGLEIFGNIYPFWDGEDNYFNVKNVTAEELAQFSSLKKVITMDGFSKKAIKVLRDCGIEVEL